MNVAAVIDRHKKIIKGDQWSPLQGIRNLILIIILFELSIK